MRASTFLERELDDGSRTYSSCSQRYHVVLPRILADFPYIDDNWRTLAAIGTAWAGQGRLFADWFYQALTFTGASPNIFPALLLATLAMSLALTGLTFHYFAEPTLACCLVPLPLWYNPFLLQNLSYQYHGPSMVLSMVAVIYAITVQGAQRGCSAGWCRRRLA